MVELEEGEGREGGGREEGGGRVAKREGGRGGRETTCVERGGEGVWLTYRQHGIEKMCDQRRSALHCLFRLP